MMMLLAAGFASAGYAVDTSGMPSVEYRPGIEGVGTRSLRQEIEEAAMTFRLKDRPPATLGQLRRRLDADIPRIEAILTANGYYDAETRTEVDTERDPVRVAFRVEPGEVYRFNVIDLHFYGSPDPALEKITPGVRRNSRAVSARMFNEQQRIITRLQRMGYPFPKLERRTVTLDREERLVDVRLEFNVGRPAVFGDFKVEGLDSVNRKFIKRQLPWKPGDPYDAERLDDFERRLLRTGLFATTRVEPLPSEGETNAVPIRITVSERDKRTVRMGVNYSDIGWGARVQWEHRNFLGSGEHLETSVTWSEIELGGKVSLRRPGFLRANQSLVLDLDVSDETPEAYEARKARTLALVLRDFTPEIQAGLGIGYQYSRVEQLDIIERYGLVLFPLQGALDYRNDQLNPVGGSHLLGRTAYYHDTLGSDSFIKSAAEARHYYMLWKRYRISSALRLTAGSIDGASIEQVPADERFYAGGGGSIRGYEYQAVGPSAPDGTPLGGDKLLGFSAELRLQPGPRLGFAAFVDGGTVYNDLVPDADRSLRYGAGFGLRWFTAIGPLRADVAYPLNPDSTQVERVQFYISLGQAF
jgi:translocation and assembly module TamA